MFFPRVVVHLVIWAICVSGSWPCPGNCKMTNNPDFPTCDSDKVCVRGCKDGFFGVTCNMSCDDKCERGACQQLDGSCNCLKGYKFNAGVCESHEGVKCISNEHCLKNRCETAGREDCLEGCKPGWFGQFCKQKCFDHCNCEGWPMKCASCEEGWFGTKCQSPCSPGCRDKNCGRNGTCTNGCAPGSYGKTCDQNCSRHCESGCDRLSGECVQCEAGWYGSTCESECSPGCVGSNKNCDRDGTCLRGCRNGHYGETCESTCPEQCYEDRCDMEGTCSSCKLGFYGTFCRQSCRGCKGEICEKITGNCFKGCESGYYGSLCNLTCEDCGGGECDMDTGECGDTGVQYWVGGGVAAVLIIIVIGVVYMSYRFKRMHGVMHDVIKWKRRPPSALQDVGSSVVAPGYVEIDNEVTTPSTGCSINPTRQTSYLHPRHSSGSVNSLQQQSGRQNSYVLPNYSELNDMMASLPQPPRGAEESASALDNASLSVVVDVHVDVTNNDDGLATVGEITIPLIADCFEHIETDDSSTDEEHRPENYEDLFRDHYVQ